MESPLAKNGTGAYNVLSGIPVRDGVPVTLLNLAVTGWFDWIVQHWFPMNYFIFSKNPFALSCGYFFFCLSVGSGYSLASNVPFIEFEGHTGAVNFAAFSPDGKTVVTASKDKTARIWDVVSGKELKKLEGHTGEINTAIFSPDGKRIVTASWDNTARIWDAESGKQLNVYSEIDALASYYFCQPLTTLAGVEPPKSIRFASFSPNGKEVAVALNLTVRILDAESGKERQRLNGHLPGVVNKSGRAPLLTASLQRFFRQTGKELLRQV